MKILVFAGPSLPPVIPKIAGDIKFFPPAGQCDVLSCVHRLNPDVVVLADTLIWPNMSVLHKELLWSLARGVRLVGTGAGGALRAAELAFCGMKGHGWVYDRTKPGLLEDDAEVFCTWEKINDTYMRITEPLVNIRATLEMAVENNRMNESDSAVFLTVAKSIYYKTRTLNTIEEGLGLVGLSSERAGILMDCFKKEYRDIQAEDLSTTLEKLSDPDFLPEPVTRETLAVPFDDQGAIFRMLYDHDRIAENEGHQMRLFEISNFIATRHPQMENLASNAFNRELVLVLAEKLGLSITQDEVTFTVERFKRTAGLKDSTVFKKWLTDNDLSKDDFSTLMEEETQIKKLQETFLTGQMFQKNTRPVLNYLRLTNEYTSWRTRAFKREKIVQESDERLKQDFLSEDLLALIMERHQTDPLPWKDLIQPAADAIGIGAKELKIELLKDKIVNEILIEQIEEVLY